MLSVDHQTTIALYEWSVDRLASYIPLQTEMAFSKGRLCTIFLFVFGYIATQARRSLNPDQKPQIMRVMSSSQRDSQIFQRPGLFASRLAINTMTGPR